MDVVDVRLNTAVNSDRENLWYKISENKYIKNN